MAPSKRARAAPSGAEIARDPTFPEVQFTCDAHKVRFTHLKSSEIIPTRFICRNTLRKLGWDTDCEKLFNGVGMGTMYSLHRPTFARITLEFLSSLEVEKNKNTGKITGISFRLMNKTIQVTLERIGSIFGLPCTGNHLAPTRFDHSELWKAISGENLKDEPKMKEHHIHSPIIRVWHRSMGWTIFGRHEPHNMRSDELFILGSYLRQRPSPYQINLAHHMMLHLQKIGNNIRNHSPIVVGGLITQIAKETVGFVESRHQPITGVTIMDSNHLNSISFTKYDFDDRKTYLLIRQKLTSIALPNADLVALEPDQERYLLPIARTADTSTRDWTRTTLSYGRNAQGPTPSSYNYDAPPETGTSSSAQPSQYLPIDPKVWELMEGMNLGIGKVQSSLEDFRTHVDKRFEQVNDSLGQAHQKIDRIYVDQALGNYPLYEDYASRNMVNPDGPFPSYFNLPNGGYTAPGVHGTLNLNPDYYSAPSFQTSGGFGYNQRGGYGGSGGGYESQGMSGGYHTNFNMDAPFNPQVNLGGFVGSGSSQGCSGSGQAMDASGYGGVGFDSGNVGYGGSGYNAPRGDYNVSGSGFGDYGYQGGYDDQGRGKGKCVVNIDDDDDVDDDVDDDDDVEDDVGTTYTELVNYGSDQD